MARNYRKEYDEYHGTRKQKDARNSRNKARRKMGLENGDSREVDHKDGNPNNNSKSNLRAVSRKTNREKGADPMPYPTQQRTGPRGDEQESREDSDLSKSMDAKSDGELTMLDKLGLSDLMASILPDPNRVDHADYQGGPQEGSDPEQDADTDTDSVRAPGPPPMGRKPPATRMDSDIPASQPAPKRSSVGQRVSDLLSNR